MPVLVSGGADYIGSITVELLHGRGQAAIVLDGLVRGYGAAVPPGIPFIAGDVGDSALVERCVHRYGIDCFIHLAALAYVGESVTEPERYFQNNVTKSIQFGRWSRPG